MITLKKILLAWLILAVQYGYAQELESLFKKANEQLGISKGNDIYLHLDKSLYETNEKIWFAGYTLKQLEPEDSLQVLHVLLVDDMSQRVITHERFLIENNLCNGSIYLPDTLQSGEYSLLAYNNHFLQSPSSQSYFRQSLEVVGQKPLYVVKFKAGNQVEDDSVTINARIIRYRQGVPRKVSMEYTLYADGEPVKRSTSEANILDEIPIKVSLAQALQVLELRGTITEEKGKAKTNEKLDASFKVPVLWESNDLLLQLIPDGNGLKRDLVNRLYFRITNTTGEGYATRLSLLEDDHEIATTVSDVVGLGEVSFVPVAGRKYHFQIKDQIGTRLIQQFPPISKSSYDLSIDQSVNDSVFVWITAPVTNDPMILAAHNSREILAEMAIKLVNGKGKLKLSTAAWPAGVTSFSLFNDKEKLQVQRSVLLNRATLPEVQLHTDSASYHPFSTVNMHIKITDSLGNPVKGIFSFSCVADKRITERWADISRFTRFDMLMPSRTALPSLSYLEEDSFSTSFLAAYSHMDAYDKPIKSMAAAPEYDGHVKSGSRKFKPVELNIIGSAINTVSTNGKGEFAIPIDAQLGTVGSYLLVGVNTKNPELYNINFDTTISAINARLAKQYFSLPPVITKDKLTLQQKEEMQLSKATILQNVDVTASTGGRSAELSSFSNNCNDYVCMYGILNCPNHPGCCSPAIEGHAYNYQGRRIIYHCIGNEKQDPAIVKLKPIFFGDQFNPVDLSHISRNNVDPDLLKATTLYWNPIIVTNDKGEADLTFYTNETSGKFRCILQGISSDGMLSASTQFDVNK